MPDLYKGVFSGHENGGIAGKYFRFCRTQQGHVRVKLVLKIREESENN